MLAVLSFFKNAWYLVSILTCLEGRPHGFQQHLHIKNIYINKTRLLMLEAQKKRSISLTEHIVLGSNDQLIIKQKYHQKLLFHSDISFQNNPPFFPFMILHLFHSVFQIQKYLSTSQTALTPYTPKYSILYIK